MKCVDDKERFDELATLLTNGHDLVGGGFYKDEEDSPLCDGRPVRNTSRSRVCEVRGLKFSIWISVLGGDVEMRRISTIPLPGTQAIDIYSYCMESEPGPWDAVMDALKSDLEKAIDTRTLAGVQEALKEERDYRANRKDSIAVWARKHAR